jgi:emp24/gp25L/p24 family/GOLD
MVFRTAVFSCVAACVLAAVVSVPAAGKECFVEVVESNNKLVGSFEVLSGGLLDIDATVRVTDKECAVLCCT